MVALLTPESSAMASTLVISIPLSAINFRAAAITASCARSLRGLAIVSQECPKVSSNRNQKDRHTLKTDEQVPLLREPPGLRPYGAGGRSYPRHDPGRPERRHVSRLAANHSGVKEGLGGDR